ncbi:MAG: hypothetical protein NVS9B1_08700 [Candidatus Dormibacteraceae bacterium]
MEVDGLGDGGYRDERPGGQERATVLLLHGWAGTAELNWSHVYEPLLARGYRILAFDLPGHGRGARDIPFTIGGVAAAAAHLVRQTRARKVIVVGHSMGGSIALEFAHRYPDEVAGLVLMATQSSWPGIPPGCLLTVAGRLASLVAQPVLRWGARSIVGDDEVRNQWIHEELSHSSIPHLAQALVELRRFDAGPWLSELRVPAVVLVTTLDTVVPPERQRLLAGAIPGAVLLEVEIDHSDPPSRPGLFPDRLVDAVDRCLELHPSA